jgi:hypothetical protein
VIEEEKLKYLQVLLEHYLYLIGNCSKENPVKAKIALRMYDNIMAQKQKILLKLSKDYDEYKCK